MRFEVVQKNKVRGCDSATTNMINQVTKITEKLQLPSTDTNVAALRMLKSIKPPRVSLKTSIDVPMLGDIIEQNGDGLLEESHMPVGWPLHIGGAVRQRCIHRDTTLQERDDLLSGYDMKRDLAEINRKAPQWSHKAVWNKWYMEPKAGLTLSQMWINAEADITQKTSRSNEIRDSDLRRVASAVTSLPAPQMADSPFLKALGTPTIRTAPAQTGELAQRAVEEWERNVCENKAVAILNKMQEGKTTLIKKDGGEMLIAIVLDKPLSEAQALVDDPPMPLCLKLRKSFKTNMRTLLSH